MEETLHALGGIIIKAIPTFILVILLNFFLKYSFFRPLERILKSRYDASEGARKRAEETIAIAETKAASVALFRRDGAALRQMQEASPGFFAQLDRVMRVPILAGAGAALILRGDTVLGAVAVSGGMMPGQDDECAAAGLAVLAP